jgi:glycopeptide antibiotics resistance protein
LPLWLLNWSNTYFNLRTAIPFIALSFLLEAGYFMSVSSITKQTKTPFWMWNLSLGIVLVCMAELGQFFRSHRHPDFTDVMFGVLGSFLGILLYYLLQLLAQLIFIKNEK